MQMCFPTYKETHDVKTVVNDDKFDRGSLTEPTGSHKEKITNNIAFSKTVLIIDDDPDVTTPDGSCSNSCCRFDSNPSQSNRTTKIDDKLSKSTTFR